MIPNINNLPSYDTVGVMERVDRFCKRSIKKSSKVEGLKLALSMIDLTTLEGKDTPGKVRQLCYKALHLHDQLDNSPVAQCAYAPNPIIDHHLSRAPGECLVVPPPYPVR
jgi:deoxyribose-phosphate aldolase